MSKFQEHVRCSRCGTRCSGVDPELGLVVRAWVQCEACLRAEEPAAHARTARLQAVLDAMRMFAKTPANNGGQFTRQKSTREIVTFFADRLQEALISDTGENAE